MSVYEWGAWTKMEYEEATEGLGVPEHINPATCERYAVDSVPDQVREGFHSDLFTEMFQFSCQVNDVLSRHDMMIGDLLEVAEATEGFDSLSMSCTADPFLSYVSAAGLSEEPLQALSKILEEDPSKSLEEGLDGLNEGDRSDMRRAMKRAVSQANDEVEDIKEMAGNGWGTEEATWESVSLKERMELYKKMRTPNVKKVLEEAGRWLRLFNASKKSRESAIAVTDIELGSDLGRVLPSELVMLKDPLRRMVFMRNLLENRCLQYSLEEKQPKGKGPVIIVHDQSGSMAGQPDMTTKGLIMAIDAEMRKQGRPVIAVPFAGTVRPQHTYVGGHVKKAIKLVEAADFRNSNMKWSPDIQKFVSTFVGGGTDIPAALNWACYLAKMTDDKADVVLITDAEYGFTPKDAEEVIGMFSREGAPKLISLVIGGLFLQTLADIGPFIRVSDLVHISNKEAIAAEMNRSVVQPL